MTAPALPLFVFGVSIGAAFVAGRLTAPAPDCSPAVEAARVSAFAAAIATCHIEVVAPTKAIAAAVGNIDRKLSAPALVVDLGVVPVREVRP